MIYLYTYTYISTLLIQGRGFAILVLCFRISYFCCRRALRPGFCFSNYYLLSFNSRTRFRDPCPLLSHFLFQFAVALCAQAFTFIFTAYCLLIQGRGFAILVLCFCISCFRLPSRFAPRLLLFALLSLVFALP